MVLPWLANPLFETLSKLLLCFVTGSLVFKLLVLNLTHAVDARHFLLLFVSFGSLWLRGLCNWPEVEVTQARD
jgi:hypothetical protein